MEKLGDCVKAWHAYKSMQTGEPVEETVMSAEDEYALLGKVVAAEMAEDPDFRRLVLGKIGATILGKS